MQEIKNIIKIPDLNFNVHLMRKAFRALSKTREFDDGGGKVKYIAGIALNRIPGNEKSTKGKNIWGRYWTTLENGKEVERADFIDEEAYKEFIEDYKETYFEYIYNVLSKRYQLGRVRILKKEPRSTLSWHRDPEPRLHIPIITNLGSRIVVKDEAIHMPADGSVWIINATQYHTAFNGGEENRVHLVATLPRYKMN